MNDDELLGKFSSLASPVIGARRAATLASAVMEIEKAGDVSIVLKLTALR